MGRHGPRLLFRLPPSGHPLGDRERLADPGLMPRDGVQIADALQTALEFVAKNQSYRA